MFSSQKKRQKLCNSVLKLLFEIRKAKELKGQALELIEDQSLTARPLAGGYQGPLKGMPISKDHSLANRAIRGGGALG